MEDINAVGTSAASAAAAAADSGSAALNSQPPSRDSITGFPPSRRVTIGGMNRRSSLGLDPAAMSDLFGRRASGFGDLDIGPILGRRDSLDSTTAVLDAAIMDLTRRRLSMAVGTMPGEVNMSGMGSLPDPLASNMGMNSMAGMGTMNAMASMGNQLRASLSVPPASNKAASVPSAAGQGGSSGGGNDSIAARQQQLQEQQRELERRQKELEVQRQQLIAGMEERRVAMQQMQQQMTQNTPNPSIPQMGGAAGALGGFGGASNLLARRMSGLAAMGGVGGPPAANGQQWHICQVCNAKAFASREEALQHEAVCAAGAGALRSDSLTPRRSSLLGHRGSLGFGSLFNHRGSLSFLSDLARLDSQQPQQPGQFPVGDQLGQAGAPSDADLALARRFSLSQPTGEATVTETKMSNGPFAMMPNPLPLAMACDKDWLTPLHCFVRRHCVQVFTATSTDVATPSKGKRKPIHVGQVGIRCPHCHHDEEAKARERGSVYYPTTIASIYNATMNLLQRHLHNCASVPEEIMRRYETLKADDARSGTSKKYWVESALSLGLVDTPNGIRYSALSPPPLPGLSHQQTSTGTSSTARRNSNDFFSSSSNAISDLSQRSDGATSVGAGDGQATGRQAGAAARANIPAASGQPQKGSMIPETEQNLAQSAPLVTPEDEPFATAFSYHLLSQMQPCVFTDADRLGKRKGLPPGFPGLACRHCFGGYGSGRFFPSSIKTLSDTSKTLNVLHNHMMRCRKCPPEVRETLEKLRTTHDEERAKMKFGSQKAFFARIWDRLHKNDTSILRKRAPTAAKRKMAPSAMAGANRTAAAMLAAAGASSANFPGLAGLDPSALQNAKRRRTGN